MTAPFIDLGVHHKPSGASDRIAYGFTKVLRWTADTFFAERVAIDGCAGLSDDQAYRGMDFLLDALDEIERIHRARRVG